MNQKMRWATTDYSSLSPSSQRKDQRSVFDRTSTASPKNQVVVSIDDEKLKKINDSLSQLCEELDIDDAQLDVNYFQLSNRAIQDNST